MIKAILDVMQWAPDSMKIEEDGSSFSYSSQLSAIRLISSLSLHKDCPLLCMVFPLTMAYNNKSDKVLLPPLWPLFLPKIKLYLLQFLKVELVL